jgi:hypothetical protein
MNTDLQNYSHKRLNILTGEWVLVSPFRANRPWQGQNEELSNGKRSRPRAIFATIFIVVGFNIFKYN